MSKAIWIDCTDENVPAGTVGFLKEHYRPGRGSTYSLNPWPVNLAGRVTLNGRGQAWNNCNIWGRGLAEVARRAKNGRCCLRRVEATPEQLELLGYPELAEELDTDD